MSIKDYDQRWKLLGTRLILIKALKNSFRSKRKLKKGLFSKETVVLHQWRGELMKIWCKRNWQGSNNHKNISYDISSIIFLLTRLQACHLCYWKWSYPKVKLYVVQIINGVCSLFSLKFSTWFMENHSCVIGSLQVTKLFEFNREQIQ